MFLSKFAGGFSHFFLLNSHHFAILWHNVHIFCDLLHGICVFSVDLSTKFVFFLRSIDDIYAFFDNLFPKFCFFSFCNFLTKFPFWCKTRHVGNGGGQFSNLTRNLYVIHHWKPLGPLFIMNFSSHEEQKNFNFAIFNLKIKKVSKI